MFRRNVNLFILAILITACGTIARATTYYVSPNGDDANNSGESSCQPFKTLERLSLVKFVANDKILLQSGATFTGVLKLNEQNAESGLEIGSYGAGKAVINVPAGRRGILVENLGSLRIAGLKVIGSGVISENHNGIEIINSLPGGKMLADVEIDDVEVAHFGYRGLFVISTVWQSGFRNLKISRVIAHDNAHVGIEIAGVYPDMPHENTIITDTKAYHNPGILDTPFHSGNGIMLGGTRGGRIEYCEAWDNGENNTPHPQKTNGPLGIWAWSSDRVIIQFNKSHHNHTKNKEDGGGFDMDGGTSNSVIQFNYSGDNDGYGLLFSEYGHPNPYINNTIRYNVSLRDGNLNDQGAILIWGPVLNSKIEHNFTYSIRSPRGITYSIDYKWWSGDNLLVKNNIFYSEKGIPSMNMRGNTGTNLWMDEDVFVAQEQFDPVFWNDVTMADWHVWRARTGFEPNGLLYENIPLSPEPFEKLGRKDRLTEQDFYDLEKELLARLQERRR